jgi:hypothetical protein
MDNMTIGATTAAAAKVTTLNIQSGLTLATLPGTSGQVLTSAGTGAVPTWTTPTTGTVTSVTGTAPVVSSGGATPAISMPAATTSVSGYLTSTDWTTFNNKGSGSVTSVAATVPAFLSVTGSPITSSGTLAISYSGTALPVANGGTNATSASITAFNNITGYTASGATGTTSTNLVFSTAPSVTNPTVTNYVETPFSANSSTAITIALTNGTVQIITLTGSATITMPTAVSGKSFIMFLRQDATGSRTVTWSTVNWPGGTAPTVTSTASKQDIYSFFSDGTSWYGVTVGQNYTQ